MNALPPFKENSAATMGVELELQLVNLHSFNLAMEAEDFLRRLSLAVPADQVKPEITKSMIELNTSIHSSYKSLLAELCSLRDILVAEASKTHIGVCGGGTHPFQLWREQRIFHTERFTNISEQYGYLAKQFTVFGQHIHIACSNGDDALYLCHAFARYIPQFIALSAASPFNQGIDTSFDCSRLAVISAFPLSGTPPWVLKWSDFEEYYVKMACLNVVSDMKDFYWDIRPKPEFGTVELRICDTPLTVETAALLAAYAQMLSMWLLENRATLSRDIYLTYLFNRFRAARYGFAGTIVDIGKQQQQCLADDILETCVQLEAFVDNPEGQEVLNEIRARVKQKNNDAKRIRTCYLELESLNDVVRVQTEWWKGHHSHRGKP